MGKMYGLTLALIIFEGIIIIECDNWPKNYRNPIERIHDLNGVIIGETNSSITKNPLKGIELEKPSSSSNQLKDYVIIYGNQYILPRSYVRSMIKFDGRQNFDEYFNKFGDGVKKIVIDYRVLSFELREAIPSIIKICANNLQELQISCVNDTGVWDHLLNQNGEILFPKIKTFQFFGNIDRNNFELKPMFPNVKSIRLSGSIKNTNCFRNVKSLTELVLFTDSIPENQLDSIYANNRDLLTLGILALKDPTKTEPIANRLMKPFKPENLKLQRVKHLIISFGKMRVNLQYIPFKMRCLEMVTLNDLRFDDMANGFIGHLKQIQSIKKIRIDITGVNNFHEIEKKIEDENWSGSCIGWKDEFYSWCVRKERNRQPERPMSQQELAELLNSVQTWHVL